MKKWLQTFGTGLCVGAADIVPGISGGTVAFIMGIYEKLLKSIATLNFSTFSLLFRGRFKEFFHAVAWQFLLAFIAGAITSIILFAKIFTLLLNHEVWRTYLYSAFIGLVIGSCIFCFRILGKIRFTDVCTFLVGCIVAWSVSGAPLASKPAISYSVPLNTHRLPPHVAVKLEMLECKNVDKEAGYIIDVPASAIPVMIAKKVLLPDQYIYDNQTLNYVLAGAVHEETSSGIFDLWIVACGIMAISAMLLPGISGSYLLNVLGMYAVILGGLVDWVQGIRQGVFDWPAFRIVASMSLGIAIGAIGFARVVTWLLQQYRQATSACLIGFMVGALRAVWPFWSYAYMLDPTHITDGPKLMVCEPLMPQFFSSQFLIALIIASASACAVLAVEAFAHRKKHSVAA